MDTFKSFTGVSSDNIAKKFLTHFNGDVNAAVSAYFDNPTPSWMTTNPVCRYFREGFCRDGMRCRYRHPTQQGNNNNNNNGGIDAAMIAAIAASKNSATQRGSVGKKASTVREVLVSKGKRLRINHGDLSVDNNEAIVNAANKMLDHAGGLAGILVKKGGDQIQHESFRKLKEVGQRNQWGRLYLPDASVVTTSSGKLPCKCVIHAVGPVWNGGPRTRNNPAAKVLKQTVMNILRECEQKNLISVSIPAISTGKFGFDKTLCATIMIETVFEYLKTHVDDSKIQTVDLTNFDRDTVDVFVKEFDRLKSMDFVDKTSIKSDGSSKSDDDDDDDDMYTIRLPGKPGLWREVRDGEILNRGSEISMNLTTGRKFVRKPALIIGGIDTTYMDADQIAALRVAFQNDRVENSASEGKRSEIVMNLKIRNDASLEIRHGDLTVERTDAIVNAANKRLQHAGALAGAIVRKGGQVIQVESNQWLEKNGQDDPSGGDFKILPQSGVCCTSAGNLPCKYVIHAVGPSWSDSESAARIALLTRTVQNCLSEAHKLGDITSIAIPAISTGAFGFPKKKCAEIMIRVAFEFLNKNPDSKLKLICLTNFDRLTVDVFKKTLIEFKTSLTKATLEESKEEDEEEEEEESKEDTNITAGAIVPISSVRDVDEEGSVVESTKVDTIGPPAL